MDTNLLNPPCSSETPSNPYYKGLSVHDTELEGMDLVTKRNLTIDVYNKYNIAGFMENRMDDLMKKSTVISGKYTLGEVDIFLPYGNVKYISELTLSKQQNGKELFNVENVIDNQVSAINDWINGNAYQMSDPNF